MKKVWVNVKGYCPDICPICESNRTFCYREIHSSRPPRREWECFACESIWEESENEKGDYQLDRVYVGPIIDSDYYDKNKEWNL